jgi:hypothetical protein
MTELTLLKSAAQRSASKLVRPSRFVSSKAIVNKDKQPAMRVSMIRLWSFYVQITLKTTL